MTMHIGIVGCSAGGAALCYQTICVEGAKYLGPHAHPEVSMHTPSLARYVACLEHDDIAGIGELMLASANKLASIGANFLICPDNTIHKAFEYVEKRSPIPWLHIAEVVVNQAVNKGFKRVALLGTRWLVDSDVYSEKLMARGLEIVCPNEDEREEINRIIMDELINDIFKPESIECYKLIIERMKNVRCDAVILGCTEIPLIINDLNSPLPTLDSTRLLARAALHRAVQREIS